MSRFSCADAAAQAGRRATTATRKLFIPAVTACSAFWLQHRTAWRRGTRGMTSAPLHQLLDDEIGSLLRAHRRRVDADLRLLRLLIGAVDAGEVLELAGARLRVEALGVALLGFGERRIDE